MRGHTDLIAMRQHRRIPARGVLIEVSNTPAWDVGLMAEAVDLAPDTVLISVRPDENFDRLDLRCVVGLKVLVFGYPGTAHERAIRAVCMACVTGGAARVKGVQAMRETRMDDLPESHVFFDHTKEP